MWAWWSINERLAGREGIELPRPSPAYLSDLMAAFQAEIQAEAEAFRR